VERFQHSTSTIHDVMKQVTSALRIIHPLLLNQFTNILIWYRHILEVVLNSIHTSVIVSVQLMELIYLCRYQAPSQLDIEIEKDFFLKMFSVSLIFLMIITYALAGWEGSAHDTRVLNDALTRGFPRV
jgi:hypothetical protein